MTSTLPITSAQYNHAPGHLVLTLPKSVYVTGQTVSLVTPEQTYSSRIAADPAAPSGQYLVRFTQVWLTSLEQDLLVAGHLDGKLATWIYRPDRHEVRNWDHNGLQAQRLTLLLSFPRSGSNFVQNVLKRNCRGMLCAGIYRGGHIRAQHICLKSHALDQAAVDLEFRSFWKYSPPPEVARIALVRDPRDVFLSIFDYVSGHRQTPIPIADTLDLDYYWYFFQPHMLEHLRDPQHSRAWSVAQAYETWLESWIFPETARPLTIRFEDLVTEPKSGFAPIFEHIEERMPDSLGALRKLVSQNGSSRRSRGQASGWKTAPRHYAPLIDAVETRFGDHMARLGYK